MGYIYFKTESDDDSGKIAEIEEKTGIKFTYTGTSYGEFNGLKIQFPGREPISISMKINIPQYFFADMDECVFIMMSGTALTTAPLPSENSTNLFWKVIIDAGEKIVAMNNDINSYKIQQIFNLPENYSVNDEQINSFEIYPAVAYVNYIFSKMFVNYKRLFTRGLILETDNGDRYFTLGSYFLYKIN